MFEDPGKTPVPEPQPAAEPLGARSLAEERFQTCRWRSARADGTTPHCTHRDVLPFAGTAGFNAAAWCPECAFYKARRTPKKRSEFGY